MNEQIEIRSIDDLYTFIEQSDFSIEQYCELLRAYTGKYVAVVQDLSRDEFLRLLNELRPNLEQYGHFPPLMDVCFIRDSDKKE